MDRLRALQAFVRAAELGSLSAAARELSTTQPTISKLVSALEHSIRARLLERGPSRAVLTREGERFLDHARRLLEDWEEAVGDLQEHPHEPRGRVRVAVPVALGELHLNAAMLALLERHPQLEVDLVMEDRFVDLVEERFDVAVRIGPPPPDLVARELARWPRYIVASPAYLQGRRRPVRPGDLAAHDFLQYARSGADDAVVLDGPEGTVVATITSRYRANSATSLLEAVLGGAGIAFQPCWMVEGLIRDGRLVRLLPRWTGPVQVASIVYPQRRRQPRRVQAVIDRLEETVKGLSQVKKPK